MWVSRGGCGYRVGLRGGSCRSRVVAASQHGQQQDFKLSPRVLAASLTAWAAAKSLASHYLFFFFFEKPLTLSVLPQPQIFRLEESFHLGFLFFLSFFRLDFGDWSLLLGCWVCFFFFFWKINLLIFIYFLQVGQPVGLPFQRGPSLLWASRPAVFRQAAGLFVRG